MYVTLSYETKEQKHSALAVYLKVYLKVSARLRTVSVQPQPHLLLVAMLRR